MTSGTLTGYSFTHFYDILNSHNSNSSPIIQAIHPNYHHKIFCTGARANIEDMVIQTEHCMGYLTPRAKQELFIKLRWKRPFQAKVSKMVAKPSSLKRVNI